MATDTQQAHDDALDPYEQAELQAIQRDSPNAMRLLKLSDEYLAVGKLAESADALREARQVEPNRLLLDRSYCEVVTDLGRHSEAVEACRQALRRKTGLVELRMMVRALLLSGKTPNTDQLAEALWMLAALRRIHSGSIYRYAAESDLAASLGDWNALSEYVDKMQLIDPKHRETKRAAALLHSKRVGWHIAGCWILLLVLVLATMVHASRKVLLSAWRTHALRSTSSAIVLGLVLQLVPQSACARESDPSDPSGKFAINHEDPEASIPSDEERNRAPLDFGYFLMGLSDRAEAATKRGDHKVAVRYYRALSKAVPDKAIGFSKLCEAYAADKDLQNAAASCRAALALDGVRLEDYRRFVDVLLARKEMPNLDEVKELDDVAAHVRNQLPDGVAAAQIDCKIGLRIHDTIRMRRCTERLEVAAASDPQTITYQWAYALMRGDQNAARRYIGSAKVLEMDPEAIKSMQLATEQSVTLLQRIGQHAWLVATFGVVGLFALSVLFAARRRVRMETGTLQT